MNKHTLRLMRAGIIGALYVVLSLVTLPISGGAIQFRVSEGLTLLPLLYLEAVPALFIGCFLFNLLSGLAFYDVLIGSLVTLVAGLLTYLIGKVIKPKFFKILVGGLFPVLLNALILPIVWIYLLGQSEVLYLITFVSLLISQTLSVYTVGSAIYLPMAKYSNTVSFLQ